MPSTVSGLPPSVLASLWLEVRNPEVAERWRIAERAVRLLVLAHDLRRHGPAVVQVDLERRARSKRVGVVVIVLHERGVVDRAAPTREGARGGHVVDVAWVVRGPPDEADRSTLRDRNIDEALGAVALVAVGDRVAIEVEARREARRIGLVRDDADRAGLRTRPIKRALRSRERLDSSDVVDAHIERALDGCDGLFIEVDADTRSRAGVIVVLAACDAAHVDPRGAGAECLVRDARQEFHVIVKARDMQLLEPLRADRLDAEWHVLQAFFALLCRDDHFIQRCAA